MVGRNSRQGEEVRDGAIKKRLQEIKTEKPTRVYDTRKMVKRRKGGKVEESREVAPNSIGIA